MIKQINKAFNIYRIYRKSNKGHMSAKVYQVWCRNGGKDHAWYKYKPKNNQRGRKKEKKEKEKEKKK